MEPTEHLNLGSVDEIVARPWPRVIPIHNFWQGKRVVMKNQRSIDLKNAYKQLAIKIADLCSGLTGFRSERDQKALLWALAVTVFCFAVRVCSIMISVRLQHMRADNKNHSLYCRVRAVHVALENKYYAALKGGRVQGMGMVLFWQYDGQRLDVFSSDNGR
eukprot:6456970-Amphidinium_carterae.2